MLELQLAQLEAAEKAATPRPWQNDPLDGQLRKLVSRWDKRLWAQDSDVALMISLRNAAPQFIALAKTGVELRTCFMAGDDPQLLVKLLGQQFAILDEISTTLPSVKEPVK